MQGLISLIEARPVKDPASRERLVWVHSMDARNDPGGLLIPFRLAAAATDLGLWIYAPWKHQLDWLGGAPALALLFPHASAPLSRVVRRVHPDDRKALGRLVRSTAAQSPWISPRFRTENEGWHHLACQTRRIQLGYAGLRGDPRRHPARDGAAESAGYSLAAERQRANEITDFSAALITAASEQELQQVVLTRVAATFGGTGAVLTLLDNETRLLHASDARVDPRQIDAMEGLPPRNSRLAQLSSFCSEPSYAHKDGEGPPPGVKGPLREGGQRFGLSSPPPVASAQRLEKYGVIARSGRRWRSCHLAWPAALPWPCQ
ncbi:hypothetical protein ACFYWN_46300 [Streptomyces sp. NPDC002917]|uniref:hypothetical protein n=1 Tax=Streptomyces sp. NPDC002917 TaxID=3364671 RepID=UPI003674920F